MRSIELKKNDQRKNKETTIRIVTKRTGDNTNFIEMHSREYTNKRTKNNYTCIELTSDQIKKIKDTL